MAKVTTNWLLNTFVYSSAGILILTGFAKLASATGGAAILDSPDVLFPLKNRTLLCVVGIVEFVIVGFLLSRLQVRIKMAMLLWLALSFSIYKIGLWCIHAPPACPCLGTISQSIGTSRIPARHITDILLVYLLSGPLVYFGFGNKTHKPLTPSGLTQRS
jgi:hypothetical protein